jgi:hypothetical protein
MVVKLVGRSHPVVKTECPEELLESKYIILRDEMLWREYDKNLARGDPDAVNNSLRILRVIRETSE